MVLTDTHTHLYLEHFKKDIDLVIERAISSNISRFFYQQLAQNILNQ